MIKIQYSVLVRQKEVRFAFAFCIATFVFFIFIMPAKWAVALLAAIFSFVVFALLAFYIRRVRGRRKWLKRHNEFCAFRGQTDILLIGDSLIANWPSDIIEHSFSGLKVLNFGIGGDRTHEILWRIRNGELDNMSTKAIVLLCGANNVSAEENHSQIIESIGEVVNGIGLKLPNSNILVLGILPFGKSVDSHLRKTINQVNSGLSLIFENDLISYIDIGNLFLDEKNKVNHTLMPDLQHLNRQGYKILADSLHEPIAKLVSRFDTSPMGNRS